ncbi:hypothetical protein AURANDRAFT_67162 [Aureococcus anophagefferens]|uniref:Uncharacterized protein n=1 Tax=Aureococcus anophagefferens TaxID=44056 RepID=F0YK95_AURAN|nr:hypothetical protein AURANDRAFT_67162 [Aureococcus anophagefferens]EGB04420.1 hypothetical protein AURANDRAFT_67162 [Aureococcus anophagefferens]|eukprot:XP_009040807.1 hypothetical protein AURANDRAFT_67162 [Aureococcus anophagefferens]
MASRWALRWLALVSVFVAVQLRMLLSQRAPGARAAPRVGAPARNGTARRCAVAAVAPSRRPLERELHAAWVEAAARALEAFAFDEPPLPVVFHDSAFSADERRALGCRAALRVDADLLFLPGAAPDPFRRLGAGGYVADAGGDAPAPEPRGAARVRGAAAARLGGARAAAARAASPVYAAFASAVDFWVRPDVAAFLAALAEDAGDVAGWRLLEGVALAAFGGAVGGGLGGAPRVSFAAPPRLLGVGGAPAALGGAAARGALDRWPDDAGRRRRAGAAHAAAWARDLRDLGADPDALAAKRSRPPGLASSDALLALAEAVGVACGGSAAVRSHAVLVPRACCCPLATRRRDAFDRDLLKRAYRLGALAGDPNPDARDVARNKLPAYLHYWYGL